MERKKTKITGLLLSFSVCAVIVCLIILGIKVFSLGARTDIVINEENDIGDDKETENDITNGDPDNENPDGLSGTASDDPDENRYLFSTS